jgi:acetyl-CoA synthetase
MPFAPIGKPPGGHHNLVDYASAYRELGWNKTRAELAGLPQGGLNIAYEALDRHLPARGHARALRCIDAAGSVRDFSVVELALLTNRFANVLRGLGALSGERLFTLLGPVPELYIAVLGALKAKIVVSPLFTAFGPEPILTRMRLGSAKVLVTSAKLYEKRVRALRSELDTLEHVLVTTDPGVAAPPGTHDLNALLAAASDRFALPPTRPDDLALLHFTSGTTGTPKGAMHVHEAVVAHLHSARLALDLQRDDVFWCTADPGWVTGMSYGVVAPLVAGVPVIAYDGPFDPERWYQLLEEQRVTVWYTAPTAVRMLMREGTDLPKRFDLGALRFIGSVGEPLNPEAVVWGLDAFGKPIHDNWWQTETGAIMIANFAATAIKPGSMGLPLPGVEAAIVRREGAQVVALEAPDEEGELALRPSFPSLFRGYLGAPERYAKCFAGGYYLTGDLARRDADGYYWFVGRADDVIKSSGHLVGPFEVESALMEHPAVVEAGVIGVPDEVAGNVIKAFVSLRPGYQPSDELRLELLGFARKRLGPGVAPRDIAFDANLPRTKSGKIMRRVLRARELGLPLGDLSTLEGTPT